jgi:pyruvate dehydrogenase E1 component alpha subunit
MDCLRNFRARVKAEGSLDAAELDAIDDEVLGLIEESVKAARASAPPAEADLLTDVYAAY